MDAVVPGISRSAGEFPVYLALSSWPWQQAGRAARISEHLGSLRQKVVHRINLFANPAVTFARALTDR
jgi:hypothetical protein